MLEDANLYYFLYGSCIYWSCFLLCDVTLKKAVSKFIVYSIMIVFNIGIGMLYFMTAFHTLIFVEYIIGFLPFILIPLLYKDGVAKIIFIYFSGLLFCLMIHMISNIFTNHMFVTIQEMNIIEELTPDSLFQILTISFVFLYTIILSIGLKKHFRKMITGMTNKVALIVCLFPIIAFAILLSDYVLLNELIDMNANVIALLTLIILILFIYIMLYVAFTKNGQLRDHTRAIPPTQTPAIKKEFISDPKDLLASGRHYYEMILNTYMDMNSRTKNLDSHLQTMNSLLMNDNIAGASVFMERIAQAFHDHDVQVVCNNHSVNLLLSYYAYLCKKEHIIFETHVDLSANVGIPDLDLCIIFGNCLENAIEACRYVKQGNNRFINLDCKVQNGHLMIIIDNTFDGFINKVNNQLKSRKKLGGIGLKTVHAVAKKYQGKIEMEYPSNVFSMFIKLSLLPTHAKRENVITIQEQANQENTIRRTRSA